MLPRVRMDAGPPLTTLRYLVLAWFARHSPGCVDDAAEALGLPAPLTRALVAELQLAELIALDSEQ